MKTRLILLVFTLLFSGFVTTSCTPDDQSTETPIQKTGGDEIDDPAEPDEDD